MTPRHATYDVIVVGGGPAGSVVAALTAEKGLRVLLLERAIFPREKVCGDCMNPRCWEIIRLLRLERRFRDLTHASAREVRICGINGAMHKQPLKLASYGGIMMKRSLLDALLLQRAREFGAEVLEGCNVTKASEDGSVASTAGQLQAQFLVGADGRNSIVARSSGMLPYVASDRVGMHAHVPLPDSMRDSIELRFLPNGYCGMADVGNDTLNLCLVGMPREIPALKHWAETEIGIETGTVWRSITPLARSPVGPCKGRILLTGDAARVVEPFTGEGIYYAMKSSALAARSILAAQKSGWNEDAALDYTRAHARMYEGRLWVNAMARLAVTRPVISRMLMRMARIHPPLLTSLTNKVMS